MLYTCGECGRVYNSKYSLKRHKRFECGKEPSYQCNVCKRKFHQKSSLNRHLKFLHTEYFSPFDQLPLTISQRNHSTNNELNNKSCSNIKKNISSKSSRCK